MMSTASRVPSGAEVRPVGSDEGRRSALRAIRDAMFGREVYGREVLSEIEAAPRERGRREALAA